MQKVVPAVIPTSSSHLHETLSQISEWSYEVQVDIVDGVFVPARSWPYAGGEIRELMPFTEKCDIEIDLMVEKPEAVLPLYLEAGVKRAVVHLESIERLMDIVDMKSRYAFELGLSILNDTPLMKLTDALEHADFIQLMGIKDIGAQGQPFDVRVLERIREFKSLYPEVLVSIDGGVTKETLPMLSAAGADRFVSGSAILKADDPERAHNELEAIANL